MVEKRAYDESFKYFKKAVQLIDDPYQKPALLTDFAVAYHNKANSLSANEIAQRKEYFSLANRLCEEATKTDSKYPMSWLIWASSLYFQENYQESWAKVKVARALDASIIPNRFLSDLSAKLPEPK